jgi:hypothetical protein
MRCSKCVKEAVAEEFCKSHFFELVEKRAKEAIRDIGWLKKGEKILVVNDGTAAGVASEYLLKKVVGGLPLKITVRRKIVQAVGAKGFDRIILPYSLDDKIEIFLKAMFEQNKVKTDKKQLLLAGHLANDELEQFLKLKHLTFRQKKKSKLGLLLDKLEQRLPKTRFALARASETIAAR